MKRIPLSGRSGIGLFALVDDEDYLNLSRFKWFVAKRRDGLYSLYAHRQMNVGAKTNIDVRMHRSIMRAKPGEDVDHKNGDGLDNRRCNLRLCTRSQNLANQKLSCRNKSGFRGVSYDKPRSKWIMQIGKHRHDHVMKRFDTVIDAARAYDAEAKKRWGEFARLNFPETETVN